MVQTLGALSLIEFYEIIFRTFFLEDSFIILLKRRQQNEAKILLNLIKRRKGKLAVNSLIQFNKD